MSNRVINFIIFLCCCYFIPAITIAQINTEWIVGFGTQGLDIGNGLTFDRQSNLIICGSTEKISVKNSHSHLDGSGSISNISKIDTSGNLKWTKQLFGEMYGYSNKILCVSSDKFIISGFQQKSITDNKSKNHSTAYTLNCIDSIGAIIWTNSITGSKLNNFNCIELDTIKNEIFQAGIFYDTLTIEKRKFASKGKSDLVIITYSEEGKVKNARTFGGKGSENISYIKSLPNGELMIVGKYENSFLIGNSTIIQQRSSGQGLFILVIDSEGRCTRLDNLGWGSNVELCKILENKGRYYICGNFTGNLLLGNKEIESKGSQDIFLAAFDKKFNLLWLNNIGGQRKEHASGLISFSNGVVLSGSFLSTLKFNHIEISPEKDNMDIFITKVDSNGMMNWFKQIGGPGNEFPKEIVCDSLNNIYISGQFKDSIITPVKILSSGSEDIFLAKVRPCDDIKLPFKKPEEKCPEKEIILNAGPGFISYDWDNGKGSNSIYSVNESRSIPLVVKTKTGCTLFDTVFITEKPSKSPYIGNDTTIFDTSSVILLCHNSFSSYLWSNDSEMPSIKVKGSDLHEGGNLIWLKTSNERGCEGYDDIIISVLKTKDIYYSDSLLVNVFPNPANECMFLTINNSFNKVKISIYDMLGKEIFSKNIIDYIKDQKIAIQVSSFPPGIYTLKVNSLELDFSGKIVRMQ
jgi:hypothetical protein